MISPPPFVLPARHSFSDGWELVEGYEWIFVWNKMRPFYVYMLLCNDGSYYAGHTDNIDMRLSMHKQGMIDGYTKTRLPIRLIFLQEFGTRDEALLAERQIKGWSRKKKKALIEGDWNKIVWLSNYKKRSSYPSTSSGRTE